jgi:hypothetical protein
MTKSPTYPEENRPQRKVLLMVLSLLIPKYTPALEDPGGRQGMTGA